MMNNRSMIKKSSVFDYLTLLQPADALPDSIIQMPVYKNKQGIRFYCDQEKGVKEVVSFHNDIILIINRCAADTEALSYLISQDDWIHMQFIVKGAARETIEPGTFIDMPEKSCIVFRQPENKVITTGAISGPLSWSVCLLLRPRVIPRLLGVQLNDFPDHLNWIVDERKLNPTWRTLPLHPLASIAIESLFSCPFKNKIREVYLYTKMVELVTIVINDLFEQVDNPPTPKNFPYTDIEKISMVHSIMETELETPASLDDLARRVGINRTKLAIGFKTLYGTSVQEYWRDLRLVHARELLVNDCLKVTEVAQRVGYSDIACFSRAFSKKFGAAPSLFRGDAIDT